MNNKEDELQDKDIVQSERFEQEIDGVDGNADVADDLIKDKNINANGDKSDTDPLQTVDNDLKSDIDKVSTKHKHKDEDDSTRIRSAKTTKGSGTKSKTTVADFVQEPIFVEDLEKEANFEQDALEYYETEERIVQQSQKKKKARDLEEPLVEGEREKLGYDLNYPIGEKKKSTLKAKNYEKTGSGKLILHTYDGLQPFVVMMNGKKFDYKRKNIPIGDMECEIRSVFRIRKWYWFLFVFVDFVLFLLGFNKFGGYFKNQGIADYHLKLQLKRRAAQSDLEVFLDRELRVEGKGYEKCELYTCKRRGDVQRRYDNYFQRAITILVIPPALILLGLLLYFFWPNIVK